MRALFIGGTVDNSELDLEASVAPLRYPPEGHGHSRYRLHHLGRHGENTVYAVYAAPELPDAEVMQVAERREYARRFDATIEPVFTLH